jgi:hypothetical protein
LRHRRPRGARIRVNYTGLRNGVTIHAGGAASWLPVGKRDLPAVSATQSLQAGLAPPVRMSGYGFLQTALSSSRKEWHPFRVLFVSVLALRFPGAVPPADECDPFRVATPCTQSTPTGCDSAARGNPPASLREALRAGRPGIMHAPKPSSLKGCHSSQPRGRRLTRMRGARGGLAACHASGVEPACTTCEQRPM